MKPAYANLLNGDCCGAIPENGIPGFDARIYAFGVPSSCSGLFVSCSNRQSMHT